MRRILIIFVHPALERSNVNKVMLQAVSGLPGVHIHDLYERYPDFFIDVGHEQRLLLNHDIILFHHPFYWYSAPALLKQWQDLVLEHGWAYGSKGNALQGKITLNAITTGGGEQAYHHDSFNRFTMKEFLAPFDQTARLCGMRFLPPFVVHGTHRLDASGIAHAAEDYQKVIHILQDPARDLTDTMNLPCINDIVPHMENH
jgi:glutathione-regulated potassium-efflux system ancillary protein KefG